MQIFISTYRLFQNIQKLSQIIWKWYFKYNFDVSAEIQINLRNACSAWPINKCNQWQQASNSSFLCSSNWKLSASNQLTYKHLGNFIESHSIGALKRTSIPLLFHSHSNAQLANDRAPLPIPAEKEKRNDSGGRSRVPSVCVGRSSNGMLIRLDTELLCMVAAVYQGAQPGRYLPVGSGHSTLIKVSSIRSVGRGNRSITRASVLSTLWFC